MMCALRLLLLVVGVVVDLGETSPDEGVLIDGARAASQQDPPTDPFSVPQMVRQFEQLHEQGLLPIEVPGAPGPLGTKYGTAEILGSEVPVYLLAKIGIGVLKAAKVVGKGAQVAAQAAAAVQGGEVVVEGNGDGGGSTRNTNLLHQDTTKILADTAGTATAFFSGTTVGSGGGTKGELFFAQAFLPDGTLSNTVVTGKFTGLPKGSSYRLLLLHSETCAAVSTFTGPSTTLLSSFTPDAKGRAALLLSNSDMRVVGPDSIVGRAVVVVPNSEDLSRSNAPVTCALIGLQEHPLPNRPL